MVLAAAEVPLSRDTRDTPNGDTLSAWRDARSKHCVLANMKIDRSLEMNLAFVLHLFKSEFGI